MVTCLVSNYGYGCDHLRSRNHVLAFRTSICLEHVQISQWLGFIYTCSFHWLRHVLDKKPQWTQQRLNSVCICYNSPYMGCAKMLIQLQTMCGEPTYRFCMDVSVKNIPQLENSDLDYYCFLQRSSCPW